MGIGGDPPQHGDLLGRGIAEALPLDALADRVAAVAFLRGIGRTPAPVTIGPYELERCLGGGGFGSVYLAIQPRLRRRVAVKVLRSGRSRAGVMSLRGEAGVLAQLNHPNVVQVYQVGETSDGTFIVMEYVAGDSLRTWQTGRASVELVAAYRQAGLGLAAAHERGILHLDFKPSNVLVGDDGRVRVVDFGLARIFVETNTRTAGSACENQAQGGTLGYASPEQFAGRKLDAQADQFSFCASLYEAMHGTLPFTSAEIARGRMRRRPARGDRRCPRWLDDVLARGLRREPQARWSSMTELLDALDPRARAPRRVALAGGIAIAIPALALAFDGSGDDACGALVETLTPAWSDARRDEVRAALTDAGPAWTPVLVSTVIDTVDQGVREVNDAAFALCTVQAPLAEQSSLRACVERRRDRIEHAAARLAEGDERLAEHADAWLTELSRPLVCARSQVAATHDDEARDRDLSGLLDRLRIDIAAGGRHDAQRRAEEIAIAALQIGEPEIVAAALLVRGMARLDSGRPDDALTDLETSSELAVASGRDDIVAESSRRASEIAADVLADTTRANRWLRLGRTALLRLGKPPHLEALQLDGEGTAARLSGDATLAVSLHRESLDVRARAGVDDSTTGRTWMLLAHALADQQRFADAADAYSRALEIVRARLGDRHPQVAVLLLARGLLARDAAATGDATWLQAAADDLERASGIVSEAPARNDLRLATIKVLHAEVLLLGGDLEPAEALARAAWDVQARLPTTNSERGSALAILAQIALERFDWQRTLELHLQIAQVRDALDDDHTIAVRDNNIAWLLCRVGRFTDARSYYLRAKAGSDALQREYASAGLGHVALATGDNALARELLSDALARVLALGDAAPADLLAELRWHLATAKIAAGDPPDSISALIAEAAEFYRASGTDPEALASLERLEASIR